MSFVGPWKFLIISPHILNTYYLCIQLRSSATERVWLLEVYFRIVHYVNVCVCVFKHFLAKYIFDQYCSIVNPKPSLKKIFGGVQVGGTCS